MQRNRLDRGARERSGPPDPADLPSRSGGRKDPRIRPRGAQGNQRKRGETVEAKAETRATKERPSSITALKMIAKQGAMKKPS